MSRFAIASCISIFLSVAASTFPVSAEELVSREKLVERGVTFLRTMQNEDGSFSPDLGPGITSLVTTSLLRSGVPEGDPVIGKALQYIEKFTREDGGIYQDESLYKNYETSLAMLCFSEVKAERFVEYTKRAQEFVKNIQSQGDPSETKYGGAGYGKHKRPDLSNTSFMIDALRASGLSEDDPAMKRALIFVSRCQNLETHHNTTPHNNKIGDGGFYYTCAAGGSSQAGVVENGGLRSYGSMTYAGLKSMIYAGVDKDDVRVKAATEWISKNYDLSKNPGMSPPHDGLFYYYHTFSKCLNALGEKTITDADGKEHDWSAELIETMAKSQEENGSWVNKSDRWLEGNAQLVTAYALLSLSYCK